MEDPFLNYFALGLLFFVVIVLVYGIIAIHGIPARTCGLCTGSVRRTFCARRLRFRAMAKDRRHYIARAHSSRPPTWFYAIGQTRLNVVLSASPAWVLKNFKSPASCACMSIASILPWNNQRLTQHLDAIAPAVARAVTHGLFISLTLSLMSWAAASGCPVLTLRRLFTNTLG
jgi:hypothetical protein